MGVVGFRCSADQFSFVGGSGSGKSVLLRTIIGLLPKREGSIEVLGTDLDAASETERRAIQRRWFTHARDARQTK